MKQQWRFLMFCNTSPPTFEYFLFGPNFSKYFLHSNHTHDTVLGDWVSQKPQKEDEDENLAYLTRSNLARLNRLFGHCSPPVTEAQLLLHTNHRRS
ncbi:hypothetical protein YC2023_082680 [Brassica napus]